MKLHWRPYRPSDQDALEAIQRRINTELGKDYEVPDMQGKGIFLCMVAEREGRVVGCWFVELVGELKFVTSDPQVTAEASRDWWEPLQLAAIHRGLRFIQVPVPKNAHEAVAEALKAIRILPSENDFYIGDLR